MIPTKIAARYHILGLIGSGATSLVHEARDPAGLLVAVKVLRPDHRLRPDLCTRFVNEALPIRDLSHPGLPRIFACEVPPGESPYIVMERLHGSLAARLHKGPLPPRTAARICAQLATTLSALSFRGIVHRDLKPANVLFADPAETDRVKLVDFGLAKWPLHDATLPVSTADTASLGTPEYMAPEQAAGPKNVDGSADVYSLGVLFYELFTGAPPFCAESAGRLRVLHLLAPPPPLQVPSWPEAQARLAALYARMLDKDRSRRPAASEIAAELAALG
jgi:serine/threonine-protein kinase